MTDVKEFSDKYYITKAAVIECGEEVWEKFRTYVMMNGIVTDKGRVRGLWRTRQSRAAVCVVFNGVYLFWRHQPFKGSQEYTKYDILNILHHYGYTKQEEQPMSKFKAMKFRVKDAEHSAHIQKYLFSLGYVWADGRECVLEIDKSFLYSHTSGMIAYGQSNDDFDDSCHQEHTLDVHTEVVYTCSPVESRATIELNGVCYYVDDLEKALQHIKPVENA